MGLYNTPENFPYKYLVVPLSKRPMALARQWWATEGSPLYFYIQGYLFSFFLMRQPLSGRKLSWSLSNGPQTTSSFVALIIQTKIGCCLASSGSWADFHGNFSFFLPSTPATTFVFKFLSYEINNYPWCSPKLQGISQVLWVQLLSRVRLFATPWTAARQASLSITSSQSPPKLMSIESVMPSNHLILCHPPLLLPSIFPNIRVFSNESALCITWPKYWSFSFNISPSNEHPRLISFRMDWLDRLAVQGTLKSLL